MVDVWETIQFVDEKIHEYELYSLQQAILQNFKQEQMEDNLFFALIQNEDLIDELERMSGYEDPFHHAKTVVIAFVKDSIDTPYLDVALYMRAFKEEALRLGISTLNAAFLPSLLNQPNQRAMKQRMNIPNDFICVCGLAVGYTEKPTTDKYRTKCFIHIK